MAAPEERVAPVAGAPSLPNGGTGGGADGAGNAQSYRAQDIPRGFYRDPACPAGATQRDLAGREMAEVVSSGAVQVYFRDVYDDVLRINDSLETYRELLSSTLDSYLSQVSNRLGKITLGLSVVATMSITFVVISGMWGMNFEHIPFSGVRNGFWWMLALQLGLGVALVLGLRNWRLM